MKRTGFSPHFTDINLFIAVTPVALAQAGQEFFLALKLTCPVHTTLMRALEAINQTRVNAVHRFNMIPKINK